MTDAPTTKTRTPITLPELNIDVQVGLIRIGRASCNAEDARNFAAKIVKLANALDTLQK